MLPRPSTTISFQMLARPERMAWVTSSPSDSLRSRSPSRPETTSRRPSGSQSMLNGNDGMRAMTSLLPSTSAATISWATQLENHRRPSCQRGDSPNARPVNRVCSSDMGRFLSFTRSQNFCSTLFVHFSKRRHFFRLRWEKWSISCPFGKETGAQQSHDTGGSCLNKGVARPHQDHYSKHFIPKDVAPSLNGDH